MSNPLAILAVTKTLRDLLSTDDYIDDVSLRPPDRLVGLEGRGQLNLYLYRVSPNATWRNRPQPDRVRPSETAFPPLALDLHYLLTAYGDDNDEIREHELLGRAMHILHNNASINPQWVQRANSRTISGNYISDLHEQIERIRVTHDPLSVDDLSKLWNTFQTQYRISTAYCVSVVLIDSAKNDGAANPVLRRGEEDRGVKVFVSLEPRLQRVMYRHNRLERLAQMGATLNSLVSLLCTNVPGTGVEIKIRDPRLADERDSEADVVGMPSRIEGGKTERIDFRLLAQDAIWQGGIYTAEVSFENEGTTRVSNQIPFVIMPEVAKRFDGRPIITRLRDDERSTLQVEVVNGINPKRKAFLVLAGNGRRYMLPRKKDSQADSDEAPVFDIEDVEPGEYSLRIRVDSVDSSLVNPEPDPESGYLEFDENMKVDL